MDQIVDKIAGLGVAGLVLIFVISTGGLAGAAAFTAALAALGGPFGMAGGLITLGLIVIISSAIAKYGVEALSRAVVLRLIEKGANKKELLAKIDKFPLISNALRRMLRDCINEA